MPNFVEVWSLCYLTSLRTQRLYSVQKHTKIVINCEQIRTLEGSVCEIQGIHKTMVQFHKFKEIYFSPYTGTTYTVSSGNCPSFSRATSSSLLMLTAGPRG